MTWIMWAYKSDGCYMHFGCLNYVKAHGLSFPIARVEITENPTGSYFGWVEDGELKGAYVWPSEMQTEMCFPYGSKAEELKGRGRKTRLSVKEY